MKAIKLKRKEPKFSLSETIYIVFSTAHSRWTKKKYDLETRGIHGFYPLSKRCTVCNNLSPYGHFLSSWNLERDWWLGFQIRDIEKLTGNGCPFCALIVRVWKHYFVKKSEVFYISVKPGWPIMLHTNGPMESPTHGEIECIEVFKDVARNTPSWSMLPSIGRGAQIFNSPNDQAVYDFITERLAECNTAHPNCLSSSKASLPTRLLEVNGPNGVSRLIETSRGKYEKYTALSYCWGKNNPLQTTSGTYKSHKEGIPWVNLPRLFQDAIEITYRLGMQYIWIDSLCIIQDDKKDWEIESERMARIYQNAELTIIAASSAGPEVPILKERAQHQEIAVFDLLEHNGSRSFLYSRPITSEDMFHDSPARAKNISQRPWKEIIYQRGWTFQEDLLARHAIHYLPNRVVWECQNVHRDERQLPRNRDALARSLLHKIFNRRMTRRSYTGQQKWWNYVEAYSGRKLTYISDKLPAMSGIANVVSQETGDDYLAGLWRRSLVVDMSWSREDDLGSKKDDFVRLPDEYVAPSWSWASLGSGEKVIYDRSYEVFELLTSPVDSGVALKGHNRFGEVKDGFITLRGPLREVTIFYEDALDILSIDLASETNFAFFRPDTPLFVGQGLLDAGEVVPTICRDQAMRQERLEGPLPKAYMVILFTTWASVIGLVLGRSSRVCGAYERLGWVSFGIRGAQDVLRPAQELTITIV